MAITAHTRFRADNTEGYRPRALAALNVRFADLAYLPREAMERMTDIELKSWLDHCAEQALADYDAAAQEGELFEVSQCGQTVLLGERA